MPEPPPGLTNDELTTRIYLRLLRLPTPRRSLLMQSGYSREEVDTALETLQSRGLINATGREVIEVFPPDTTLPAYAADLERQARQTRSVIDGLTHTYYQARTSGELSRASPGVSLLDTTADIEAAFIRAAARAESRIVRIVARSDRMDQVLIHHPESIMDLRPVTSPRLERLLVFEQSILEVDGSFEALAALKADGVDVRLTPHLAFSVLAIDRSAAVIDISHLEPGGGGSLYVQQRQLASALMDMCIGLWALSTPLPRTHTGPNLGRLTDRDGQIIALLAAGASDTTIARQLAISQRTVERRVRLVMEELGATTRFQAGAIAATRGLL